MKYILSVFLAIYLLTPVMAQVDFVQRLEMEVKFGESDYMTIFTENGLIAFRTNKDRSSSNTPTFEIFNTDFNLNQGFMNKIPVKSGYDLIGYDWNDDAFYALFQKGNSYASKDRYIIKIKINEESNIEYDMSNVLDMELKEFFVMGDKMVFMGDSESLPVIQFFDIESSNVITAQGIYSKDSKILQLRKDEELGVIDVLLSKRDQYKVKQVLVITFDLEGNKLREITLKGLDDPKMEIIEGILTPFQEYQQALIGTYGKKKQEAYQGIYMSEINEFGEVVSKYYTLENLENFYNYLPEKTRERRLRSLEKNLNKGKVPTIKPAFSTREVISLGNGYLIYSDLFTANNPRYFPRDGVYANSFYRINPYSPFYNNMFYDPYFGYRGMPYNPNFNNSREGEYKFHAAQILLLDNDGGIIWDNSLRLPSRTTNNPSKFGELSYDGKKLHFMYLEGEKLALSYIEDGVVIFENELFEIELINETERIRDTEARSLMLYWWYDNNYLLTGKQNIKYQDEDGRQQNRDVFFITKVAVNGALFEPKEK
ncbi:transcriptional regulator [Belliella pelovolcani]|nr:transcriptional regulator [Belliella pelovolcani]